MTIQTAATVAEQIKTNIAREATSGSLSERVIDALAERENKRRVDLLIKGYDKITELQKAYDQINKPDFKLRTGDALGPMTEGFTPKREQEIAAAGKKLNKVIGAFNNAVASANFSELEKALAGGGKDDSDE